jgi:hypothetical protein
MPAVSPLITSTAMPAARSASASSPPRPKTKGSPPLSRTTRSPRRASATISRWMKCCEVLMQPPRLPTGTSRGVERFFDGKGFDLANPKAYLDSLAIKALRAT